LLFYILVRSALSSLLVVILSRINHIIAGASSTSFLSQKFTSIVSKCIVKIIVGQSHISIIKKLTNNHIKMMKCKYFMHSQDQVEKPDNTGEPVKEDHSLLIKNDM
jgi:hypothetical protein